MGWPAGQSAFWKPRGGGAPEDHLAAFSRVTGSSPVFGHLGGTWSPEQRAWECVCVPGEEGDGTVSPEETTAQKQTFPAPESEGTGSPIGPIVLQRVAPITKGIPSLCL